MGSNLPIKSSNSIIEKIKSIFRKLFHKEKALAYASIGSDTGNYHVKNDYTEPDIINEQVDLSENSEDKYEVDYTDKEKNIERAKFIEQLENNPELLDTLPIEKLQVIDAFCDEYILRLEEKYNELLQKKGSVANNN